MFGRYTYHLLLHFVILIFGFTGILGQIISLDAIPLVWYRTFIAFVALAALLPLLKASFRMRSKKRLLQMLGVGVIVALHWVTFYQAIQLSTASLGILCLATTTLHVSWLEPLIIGRPFSWVEFAFSLIIVAGIYFVSGDFSTQEYTALAYGLTSALLAAIFAVLNAKLADDSSPIQMTLYEMLAAFLFLSLVLLFSGQMNSSLFAITFVDVLWLIFLGVICTSFAFLAIIFIMQRLGAFSVSLSINLEPVYTIVLAIPILHEYEVLNNRFYIGSAVIIAVVIANAALKGQQAKKARLLPK
ncbi:MAG: hypothetical protein A3D92_04595 [Bacteroidetes bacterium RIFCSPHIGHO2_02_FULL_44_7]|nr:MAG: hypothetical protein A3D92_04595 [Bacteroidetes bacterium RIFCSPHIGHO2_02_FULL_44_7]